MPCKSFSRLIQLFVIVAFSLVAVGCGEGDGPAPVAGEPCPVNGVVSFDSGYYTEGASSATISLLDTCIANSPTVVVQVDNGTETINLDVPLDSAGKGAPTILNFGRPTSDDTDTIAIKDGDVLTATYTGASTVAVADTADISNTLGVYTETYTDPALIYEDILSAADLGGKDTATDEVTSAVIAPLEGDNSLRAAFKADTPPSGGNFNGFVFDFGRAALINGTFEADDASGGNVEGATGWTHFEFVFTNNTAGPSFGPVSHDAGGTQSLTMFGPFTFDTASGAYQAVETVVAGSTYTATAYVMNWAPDPLAPNNLGIFQLTFWDAPGGQAGGGNQIGSSQIIVDSTDDGTNIYLPPQDGAEISDWTTLSITEVAPAGTVSAEIFLLHIQLNSDPAAQAGSIFWDDVSIVEGITVPEGGVGGNDISSYEVLRFGINSTAASAVVDLEVSLLDARGNTASVFLSNYTSTTSPVTGWDLYEVPLTDFPAGVDLTRIVSLGFFNASSTITGSTAVAPTLVDATLYFDNVHFAWTPEVLTGVLVDSPVEGVSFKTTTQQGKTNNQGEFNYIQDEMVTFSVGGIILGTVKGAPLITPVELTGGADPINQTATNQLVFLQSIDEDQDPLNGVTVTAETLAAAATQTLDFTLDSAGFTAAVTPVVTTITSVNSSGPNPVLSETEALDNFYVTYVDLGGTNTFSWSFPPPYPPYPPTTPEYKLIWSDEFDVDGVPDTKNWIIETGYGPNNDGWGNNEWQLYTDSPDNVKVESGNLVLTADCPTAPTCGVRDDTITSGKVSSPGKFSFRYGKVEARIKPPVGNGAWPAFWMLGANFPDVGWPFTGEIDVMEMHNAFSDEFTTHFTMHWCDETKQTDPSNCQDFSLPDFNGWTYISKFLTLSESLGDDYQIFSAEWDSNGITGFINGIEYFYLAIDPGTMDEFLKEFYLILNVAMGGTLGSNNAPPDGSETWPQTMLVDYVRVYQDMNNSESTFTIGGGAPLEPLGVYSETNTDPVLAYSEIINAADFGGKNTVTDENSTDVVLEGSVSLKADYISTGPGDNYNGFVFNFGSAGGGGSTNQLTNGSFESPDASAGDVSCSDNWSCFNAAFTSSNNFMPGGSFVNPTAYSGSQVLKQYGGDAGATQKIVASPGDTVNATVYAMNWSGDQFNNLALLQIAYFEAGGNVISVNEVFADTLGNQDYLLTPQDGGEPGDWTLMEVSGVAPAGTVEAQILLLHILIDGTPASGSIFWDDASLSTSAP